MDYYGMEDFASEEKKEKRKTFVLRFLVEISGIEPLTS